MQSVEPEQELEGSIAFDGAWPPGPVLGAKERSSMGSNAPRKCTAQRFGLVYCGEQLMELGLQGPERSASWVLGPSYLRAYFKS